MIFTITTNLLHLPCSFTLAAAASGSILDIQGHSTPQPNRKNPVGVFPIQNLKSEILNKKDVSWSLNTKFTFRLFEFDFLVLWLYWFV